MGSSIQRLANIFVARQSCTRTLFRPSIPYRSFANYLANPEIVTLNHGPNRGVLDLKFVYGQIGLIFTEHSSVMLKSLICVKQNLSQLS